ncbi:hypothetical protein [Olivibacter sp. XZL3]|uniref:hypothetical protein n=1 Tax=Olivibacter sp. XZL3 TaxID=1735116 RepID=UPI0010664436|nr:hypothetical protein [Olivibacter sp. XZL3]
MYYTFLVLSIYLGVIALIIYIFYRIIDGWINRSLNVRREQNALLAKLIGVLEKEKPKEH